MKKYFYEDFDFNNLKFNITYHEICTMTYEKFYEWLEEFRKEILNMWDTYNRPPVVGKSESEIIQDFQRLRYFDISDTFIPDKESLGVLFNFSKLSSGINQFFPTMNKTKIREAGVKNSYSIYDYFTNPSLRDKFNITLRRIIKKDSMYNYSKSLFYDLSQRTLNQIPYHGESAKEWLITFKKNNFLTEKYGITITKNLKEVDTSGCVELSTQDIRELYQLKILTDEELINIDGIDGVVDGHVTKSGNIKKYTYLIRYYDKETKLFPGILQVFNIGLTQRAVNFPALIAKWIYEKYIPNDNDMTIVYDPSAGWGGRIIGAMSSRRKIHYVGTDPNSDNFIKELGVTRYEYVADFYNKKCIKTDNDFFSFDEEHVNTYDIFTDGSEHIHLNKNFEKYKGKIDLIFTSPPYFDRELYCDESTQSSVAYKTYEEWKFNFLEQTIKTCVEYLKPGGHILWNISDIRKGSNKYLPLKTDSEFYIKKYGCKIIGEYKLILSNMIGQKFYNSIKIGNQLYKYEPIIVAQKELI